jgi:DsbC/DsbD-like thiol-disulfide interchange protein
VRRRSGGSNRRSAVAPILALLGVMSLGATRGTAAPGPDSSAILTVRIALPPGPAYPDSPYVAGLVVSVRKGWHINSSAPADENLIGTEVRIDRAQGIDSTSVRYPPPVERELAFSDAPVSVYDGSVTIPLTLYPATSIKPGTYAIPGEITYQACNATVCLQPATLYFSIPLTIPAVPAPPRHSGNTKDRKH